MHSGMTAHKEFPFLLTITLRPSRYGTTASWPYESLSVWLTGGESSLEEEAGNIFVRGDAWSVAIPVIRRTPFLCLNVLTWE